MIRSGEVRALLLGLLAGVVSWSVYAYASRPWRALGDDAYFAEVARNIAEGNGAVTSTLFPAYIGLSADGTPVDRNPYTQSIGYPALLALAFKIGGASEATAIALQGMLFVALLAATYLVARRFLPPAIAAVVVALVALEPNLVGEATVIGWDILFAVLVLATLAVVVWAPAGASRTLLLAGVALAAAQLVRPNGIVLLPAFVAARLALSPRGLHLREALALSLPLVALLLVLVLFTPTARYTTYVSSTHFLYNTASYPGAAIGTELHPPAGTEVFTTYLGEIVAKEIAGLRFYAEAVPTLGRGLITGGLLLAGLQLGRLPAARPLLAFTLLATVTTVVLAAAVEHGRRLLIFLLPSYLTLVVWALQRFGWHPGRTALAVLLLAVVLFGGEAARVQRDQAGRAAYVEDVERLVKTVGRYGTGTGAWIATDVPTLFSWQLRVPAVNLPSRQEDLRELEGRRQKLTAIVVTSLRADPPGRVGLFRDDTWRRILQGAPLPGYVVAERFEGIFVTAVILLPEQGR